MTSISADHLGIDEVDEALELLQTITEENDCVEPIALERAVGR